MRKNFDDELLTQDTTYAAASKFNSHHSELPGSSLVTALPEPIEDGEKDQTEGHVDQNGASPIKRQERRRGVQQGVLEGGHAKIVD